MCMLSRVSNLSGCLIASSLVAAAFNPAKADWAQSLGISQKSTNLGLAVTATSDDYDAFYTNPAGAANFNHPIIGFGIKTMDTRTLDVKQSDSTPGGTPCTSKATSTFGEELSLADLLAPPQECLDLSPEKTLTDQSIAKVGSGALYVPMSSMGGLVVGVGMGVPFLVASNFANDDAVGNYGKFNTKNAGLIVVETSPSVTYKINDRLNVGASLGITTAKYMKLQSDMGNTMGTGSLNTVDLETSNDITLPFPPRHFETSSHDISYTLGMQYKVAQKLTVGLTYRSKTPETFTGDVNVHVNRFGVTSSSQWLSIGPYDLKDHFKYEVELPRHIQAGIAYDATPKWKLMSDVRWTNWSDAKGFGTPSIINMTDGTIDVGAAISDQPTALAWIIENLAGVDSAPVKSLTVNYSAQDTLSLHLGTSYKITPSLELQAGYIYDPSFAPNDSVDLISLSSNRHIFSFGGTYLIPTEKGEWDFTLGAQVVAYKDRHIDLNQSRNAGGVNNALNVILQGEQNLEYSSNSQGGFDIGGYVWSIGASVAYKFGGSARH
jgi:long-chain fatty acid transport protein